MDEFARPLATPEPDDDGEGGVEVVVMPDEESLDELYDEAEEFIHHAANLAETLDEKELLGLGTAVVDDFENDKRSREDWAKAYVRGMDLLGFKVEDRSQPWEGASGVFHPIMTESVIRFQAQAMGELFPASGPARTKIVGKQTREIIEQAKRVEREINYETTEEMVEYREETEQLLFHLPMAGSAFKKIYFDPIEQRPASMFVPAEDLVVNYGSVSLEKSERFTHVMKKSSEEIDELVDAGFYDDVDLGDPYEVLSDIQEKYDELAGEKRAYSDDDRYTILEQHVTISIDGDGGEPRPYVITVDLGSQKVLAVRRNWHENDERKRKRMHFVHYKYLPGMGFYGLGMMHLLGGLTKTATSILRQLIDSGTLANLPAGLKSKGLRIKGDNTPFRPGEFRDVDVPGSAIKDHITFLPYKEPSGVLYQLLGNVIEEARRIGAVAETELTDMGSEMPVGTAFAILERQMKVQTGVQARLHHALGKELKILAKVIHDFMGPEYAWDLDNDHDRVEDFSGRVDVVPVSDPNASTTAQKVVSYQAAMQMSQQAPQLYNMGKLHRQMLDVLGIENSDEILKLPEDIKAMDPVTENMAILKQEPIKTFMYQDHEAHIAVHMAAMQDPKIQQMVGQSPFASAIQSAMASHITEHVAMQYRKEIEKKLGVSLPDMEEELPEDIEREVSRISAIAADKLLKGNQAEQAQQEAKAKSEDPVTQMQLREIALKEKKHEHDASMEEMRLSLDAFSKGANIAEMRERLNSEEARAAANLSVKLATEVPATDKVTLEAIKIIKDQASKLQKSGKID